MDVFVVIIEMSEVCLLFTHNPSPRGRHPLLSQESADTRTRRQEARRASRPGLVCMVCVHSSMALKKLERERAGVSHLSSVHRSPDTGRAPRQSAQPSIHGVLVDIFYKQNHVFDFY